MTNAKWPEVPPPGEESFQWAIGNGKICHKDPVDGKWKELTQEEIQELPSSPEEPEEEEVMNQQQAETDCRAEPRGIYIGNLEDQLLLPGEGRHPWAQPRGPETIRQWYVVEFWCETGKWWIEREDSEKESLEEGLRLLKDCQRARRTRYRLVRKIVQREVVDQQTGEKVAEG